MAVFQPQMYPKVSIDNLQTNMVVVWYPVPYHTIQNLTERLALVVKSGNKAC